MPHVEHERPRFRITSKRLSFFAGFGLLAFALAVTVHDLFPPHTVLDDAYISARYARNFAEGNGLVYNIGERVEGFTNLAWTLFLAASIRVGLDPLRAASYLDLSFALASLVTVFAFAVHELRQRAAWAAGVAVVALVAGPSFAVWAGAGLGEMLYVFAVLATFFAAAFGSPRTLLATAALATVVRPEGMLVAACAFGVRWLVRPGERSALMRSGIAYAFLLAALTTWRLWYYGLPLPNTFYAKVGGIPLSRGIDYLKTFLRAGGAPLALAALPALFLDKRLWPIVVYVVATTVFVVNVGGDVFSHNRFFLPTFALLAVAAARSVGALIDRPRPAQGLVAAMLLVSIAFAFTSRPSVFFFPNAPWMQLRSRALTDVRVGAEAMRAENQRRAEELNAELGIEAAEETVAALAIGAFGWYGDFRILDVLGLTNREIATHRNSPPPGAWILPGHQRSHADYVLALAPRFIAIDENLTGLKVPAVLDLGAHPEFQANYVWDSRFSIYRRKSPFIK
jgi:arabinofuranosyltransferase